MPDATVSTRWLDRATEHLGALCRGRDRRPGSPENDASTDYVADVLARSGWNVRQPTFDVVVWEGGDGSLEVGGQRFPVRASPYALGVDGQGPLVAASTLTELEERSLEGAVVLLHGDLTAQPLTPKGFPFHRVEEHDRLIALLEGVAPLAVLAATGFCPDLAGSLRPFPFVEDGDFTVPAGYLDEADGNALAAYDGAPTRIRLRGERRPAQARNVIGRRGPAEGRIVVTAHVDTKVGTPGALDNASGVTVVLLLAEMLSDALATGVEMLVLNGEDYYNAAGEVHNLEEQGATLDQVALAVNIDGAGYPEGSTAYSLYNVDSGSGERVRAALDGAGLVEGPQWWQSDHAVFAMRGRPSVALTSERMTEALERVVHSPEDTVERLDVHRLVQAAQGLRALVESLSPGAGPTA